MPLTRLIKINSATSARARCSISIRRTVPLELLQPCVRTGVRRGTPIASRRQRATGRDFWTIWHSRPLELAERKKTHEKQFKPTADLGQLIGPPLVERTLGWPIAFGEVPPGMPGQKQDLRWTKAKAERVI